jgi:transcription termination factor NusB
MGTRRRARVLALQSMFESDLTNHPALDILSRHVEEQSVAEETAGYARRLIAGTMEKRPRIDSISLLE